MLDRFKRAKRAKRPRSLIFHLLAWGLAAALLIPSCLILALHIPAVQKELIGKLIREIEAGTGVDIRIESYVWLPFSRLNLAQVQVRSSENELLECSKAQITYHFSSIWPYILPDELYLENPVFSLEKNAQGAWQFPGKQKSGETGTLSRESASRLFPPLPKVRVSSGTVLVRQQGRQIATIRGINGTLAFKVVQGPDGPVIKLDLGQWQGRAELPELGNWQVSGNLEIRKDRIDWQEILVEIGESGKLSSAGTWSFTTPFNGNAKISLTGFSTAEVPEAFRRIPYPLDLSGDVDLKRVGGVWSIGHRICSNMGELDGSAELVESAEGIEKAEISTRFSDLRVPGRAGLPESHLRGLFDFSATGRTLQTGQAGWKILFEPSVLVGQSVQNGELSGSYDRGNLTVAANNFRGSAGDLSFSVQSDILGLWDPGHQGEMKIDGKVDRVNLEKILSKKQVGGGTFHLEGRYGNGDFLRPEKWQGKIDANVTVSDSFSVKTAGTYKNELLDVNYELETGDVLKISEFYPDWQGRGKLASRANVKGKWNDLVWEGSVTSPLFQYGPVQCEKLALLGKGKIQGLSGKRELNAKVQNLTIDGNKIGAVHFDVEQQEDTCKFQWKSDGIPNRFERQVERPCGKTVVFPAGTDDFPEPVRMERSERLTGCAHRTG